MVDHKAVPVFVELLSSNSDDVREQVIHFSSKTLMSARYICTISHPSMKEPIILLADGSKVSWHCLGEKAPSFC